MADQSGAETVLLQEAREIDIAALCASLERAERVATANLHVSTWHPRRSNYESLRNLVREAREALAALQRRATLPTVPADLLALREALEPIAAVAKMAGPGRRGVVCGFNDTVVTWEHFHSVRAAFDTLPSSDVGAVKERDAGHEGAHVSTTAAFKGVGKRALCDAIRNSSVPHPTNLTRQDKCDLIDMVHRTRRAKGEEWFAAFVEGARAEQSRRAQ